MFHRYFRREPNAGRRLACEPLESRQLLTVSPTLSPVSLAAPIAELSTALALSLPDSASAGQPAIATVLSASAAPSEQMDHAMPGNGVEVTATQIITAHDTVPRFTANPTIRATVSGAWSDPRIWSSGRLPTTNDRVLIEPGVNVSYSIVSPVSLDNMEIGGRLTFATNANTSLTVGTLTVMPGGVLEIGTPAAPVAAGVNAELVIANRPLDIGTLAQPGIDPAQYGTGLLVFGTITTHGAQSSATWTRLATEPRAGATFLDLSEQVAGWRAGSTIVLPDSRQLPTSLDWQFAHGMVAPQWETAVVASVVGNRVYLQQPLQFDHLGARNTSGVLELLPHVGLLDHNVVIRSENPDGTRGHTFYSASASVDLEYTRFADLGRTDALRSLDSTTKNAQGQLTHLGTNQVGRYAVHFHHLFGPPNASNAGYQYRFVGNSIDGFKKWGVAIHDTNFGLLDDNVIYDGQGAGLVTEEGAELFNTITNNFALRIQGTGVDGKEGTQEKDYGRGGSGFWFRRSGNEISGNVAANTTYAGFVFSSYYAWDPIKTALARGLDPHDEDGALTLVNNPAGAFTNNEAYGLSPSGLWAAYITGMNSPSSTLFTIKDLRIWHTNSSAAVTIYHTANTLFDGLLVLGNAAAQDRPDTGYAAVSAYTYENYGLEFRNSRIEGFRTGIVVPTADGSTATHEQPTVIRDSILKNYVNILVQLKPDQKPGVGNSLVVRNVKFGGVWTPPRTTEKSGPPRNIVMKYALGTNNDPTNVASQSTVRVYDYNQIPGDNFQVFYKEQAPNFVLPRTSAALLTGRGFGVIGAPAAGLTNAIAMSTLGIAVAGRVSPSNDDSTHPEIDGFTAPIQTPPTPARVALLTPWEGAVIDNAEPIRVRYLVSGAAPDGAALLFQLDDGQPFGTLNDGVLFGVKAGTHTLRVFLADPQTGAMLPGTIEAKVNFRIQGLLSVGIGVGNQVKYEGSSIDLSSMLIAGNGSETYLWSVTKNGQPYAIAVNNRPDLSFVPGDNGVYQVKLLVTQGGKTGFAEVAFLVVNRAPTIESVELSKTVISEGETVVVSGQVTDPGADTQTVNIDWQDGSPMSVVTVDPVSGTYTTTHRYWDDRAPEFYEDEFVIRVTAWDDDQGASTSALRTITVKNVPPTALILGAPTSVVPAGLPITLRGLAWDAGSRDNLTFAWTVTKDGAGYQVQDNDAPVFTFTPNGPATYVIKFTVRDDDRGVASVTVRIVVGEGLNIDLLQDVSGL